MNWILHAVMALLLVWSGYLTRPRVHGNPLGLDTPGFKLWAGSTLLFIFAVKKNPGVEVVIEALYSAVLLGLIIIGIIAYFADKNKDSQSSSSSLQFERSY